MRKAPISFIIVIFHVFYVSIMLGSCSRCQKEEAPIGQITLFQMAKEKDPSIEMVLPTEEFPAINCAEYGEGCQFGVYVRAKGIVVRAVSFDNAWHAKVSAHRVDGLYYNNWVFDWVKGEKEVEDFVVEVFQAKRAFSGEVPTKKD